MNFCLFCSLNFGQGIIFGEYHSVHCLYFIIYTSFNVFQFFMSILGISFWQFCPLHFHFVFCDLLVLFLSVTPFGSVTLWSVHFDLWISFYAFIQINVFIALFFFIFSFQVLLILSFLCVILSLDSSIVEISRLGSIKINNTLLLILG